MATYGTIIHVYIFLWIYIFGYCFVSFLPRTGQGFSEMWIRMAGEVVYIIYSYVFGLYIFSLTAMTADHDHRCHKKDSFCLFYYFKIHISHICTFWTKTQGYNITRLVWSTWVIFCFFSYVVMFHLLLKREDVGNLWNHLQPRFHWLSRVTNGIE